MLPLWRSSVQENMQQQMKSVGMLDYLFEFADNERILLMYKKVCRRFVYEYPETISFYIMEYRKEYDRESLIGTKYEYLLHEDDDLF